MLLTQARTLVSQILLVIFAVTLPYRMELATLCIEADCAPSIELAAGADYCCGCHEEAQTNKADTVMESSIDCCLDFASSGPTISTDNSRLAKNEIRLRLIETFQMAAARTRSELRIQSMAYTFYMAAPLSPNSNIILQV